MRVVGVLGAVREGRYPAWWNARRRRALFSVKPRPLEVELRQTPAQLAALKGAARALDRAVPDWRERRKADPAVGRLRLLDVADAAGRGLTGRRALAFAAARRGVWRPNLRRVERPAARRAPRSRRLVRRARARPPGRPSDDDPEPHLVAIPPSAFRAEVDALLGGRAA